MCDKERGGQRRDQREERSDLPAEHRWGDVGQIIIGVLFLLVWGADAFLFRATTFLDAHIYLGLRVPLGVVNWLVAAYLARTSLRIVFGETHETPHVIRKSVFGIARHPMYLSEILLYLGFLCFSVSLAASAIWLTAIGFLHRIARYEERQLLARFGEEYGNYMRDVPMWLPWIWKNRQPRS
jgi:protein-S-isoprenylcysteine O-methyltransferase Ste14